jgi:hypothetical protein
MGVSAARAPTGRASPVSLLDCHCTPYSLRRGVQRRDTSCILGATPTPQRRGSMSSSAPVRRHQVHISRTSRFERCDRGAARAGHHARRSDGSLSGSPWLHSRGLAQLPMQHAGLASQVQRLQRAGRSRRRFLDVADPPGLGRTSSRLPPCVADHDSSV